MTSGFSSTEVTGDHADQEQCQWRGWEKGRGLFVEWEERNWRHRTNNSFMKFCCKGKVLEEDTV